MTYVLYDRIIYDAVSISDNIASELGWFMKYYQVKIWEETCRSVNKLEDRLAAVFFLFIFHCRHFHLFSTYL